MPKSKLSKPDRKLLASLSEVEALSVMLSVLRMKCSELSDPQQDVMRLLLAAIQRRVTILGGKPATLQSSRFMLRPLRKFTIGHLLTMLQHCRQLDATLKSEVTTLLRSASAAVHNLTSNKT